jgi:hypothetical protein
MRFSALRCALGNSYAKLHFGDNLAAKNPAHVHHDLTTQTEELPLPNGIFDFHHQPRPHQFDCTRAASQTFPDG